MMFSTNQHWTTLLSYIVALTEHVVLCFLQLKYDYIDKCSKKMFKNKMKEKANIFRKCFKMELYEIDNDYTMMESIDEKSNLIENKKNQNDNFDDIDHIETDTNVSPQPVVESPRLNDDFEPSTNQEHNATVEDN